MHARRSSGGHSCLTRHNKTFMTPTSAEMMTFSSPRCSWVRPKLVPDGLWSLVSHSFQQPCTGLGTVKLAGWGIWRYAILRACNTLKIWSGHLSD